MTRGRKIVAAAAVLAAAILAAVLLLPRDFWGAGSRERSARRQSLWAEWPSARAPRAEQLPPGQHAWVPMEAVVVDEGSRRAFIDRLARVTREEGGRPPQCDYCVRLGRDAEGEAPFVVEEVRMPQPAGSPLRSNFAASRLGEIKADSSLLPLTFADERPSR